MAAPSAVPAGTGVATPTGVIFDYPGNNLPIQQGDYIGAPDRRSRRPLPQKTTSGLAQNLIANNFTGAPADGTTAPLLGRRAARPPAPGDGQVLQGPEPEGKKAKAAKKALVAADCAAKVSKKKSAKKKQRRQGDQAEAGGRDHRAPGYPDPDRGRGKGLEKKKGSKKKKK